MNKLLFTLALAVSATAFAQAPAPSTDDKALNPRERHEKMMRKLGGFIEKPGAQKGLVLIFNAQREVSDEPIRKMIEKLAGISLINFQYQAMDPAAVTGCDWRTTLKGKGATAAVFIVYDDKSAPLLVSPDEEWAVVNVKRLESDLNADGKKRFLASRTCKQVLRAFALMSGSASRWGKTSVGSALAIDQLDDRADMLPMDQIQQLSDYLGKRGVTHKATVSYRKALMEGWAPSPTNDVQKKLWDKVHELPSNPIKIKYDPKRDK